MRRWLLVAVVGTLIGGCSDLGRWTSSRPTYTSTNSTRAKAMPAQLGAQPRTEDSPYGNSGLLKPGRTEPVITDDK
jgi:hypothetical protein